MAKKFATVIMAVLSAVVLLGCADSAPPEPPYSLGLTMVRVPAGSFQRDSTASHVSTIGAAFRMSAYEITRAQFQEILGGDPSAVNSSGGLNHPVQQTSWYHAVAFCNKLMAEGLVPVYDVTVNGTPVDWNALTYADIPDQTDSDWNGVTATWTNNGYRLPTEMEWMWAAMGATSGSGFSGTVYLMGYGKRFAGSDSILANGTGGTRVIEDCAVFGWNLGETGRTTTNGTSPAGSKANGANELGLYDMSGNVWEWCWDWYASYPGTMDPDYRGADTGTERVVRGGDWCNYATNCRVAQRNDYLPATRHHGVGFRVVRP